VDIPAAETQSPIGPQDLNAATAKNTRRLTMLEAEMILDERQTRALPAAMADENTPLLRNTWYVACFSEDLVAGESLARKIAGERVVLYRRADGTPVALKDRCAHRSFPLSKGSIDGDDVICGYHGFRYGPNGVCTGVPSQAAEPRGLSVRAYPVVEAEPLVWIWTGDPALAAQHDLPSQPWMNARSGWDLVTGYLVINVSYIHMHENLLDLTHIGFLHGKSFGSAAYASAPFETIVSESTIIVKRTVEPTFLPALYAEPLDMVDVPASRGVTSTFFSPGLSISGVRLCRLSLPEEDRTYHLAETAHLLTPIDANTIHYHFMIGRDFAIGDRATSDFMRASLRDVFLEDQAALEAITEVRRDDAGGQDRSVASDKAGIAMRRLMLRLALAESDSSSRA
jgi:phenylpropionate dioxygenase-like ring-hydroxylating dioxygenase large terminal subunit